jgi:homoserine O-acetyltransferase
MPGYDVPSHHFVHEGPFALEGGEVLPGFRLAYETWGSLNAARDNAAVIFHALSGSSHPFASDLNPEPGWWQGLLTSDFPLHPRDHYLICPNLLGGCYGSTGPSSIDPRTSVRYGIKFPQITTGDMIEATRVLVRHLGVGGPVSVIGGSLGGMLALEWSVKHPVEVKASFALVAPGRSYAQTIALRAIQRESILADPAWNRGEYHDGPFPEQGIALARKLGMVTYRSSSEFEARFGRSVRDPRLHFLEGKFEVESYLDHQGKKFAARFDPNTYLYFSRAMDLYDLARGHGSLEKAAARIRARTLLLAVDSDILCPVEQVSEVHDAIRKAGGDSRLAVIRSVHGHDSFLKETALVVEEIRRFVSA